MTVTTYQRPSATLKQAPRSPADPRPGGAPAYISPTCPACGAALVPADSLAVPPPPRAEWWEDEFVCPVCRDGITLDWPPGYNPTRRRPREG